MNKHSKKHKIQFYFIYLFSSVSVVIILPYIFSKPTIAQTPKVEQIAQSSKITVQNLQLFEGVIKALAISPDSKILLVGTGDAQLQALDLETQQILYSKASKVNNYSSIAVSPDGQILAVGDDENIIIFNLLDGEKLKILKGHSQDISDVAISPDSKTLISVSGGERNIRVWDINSGELIQTLADNIGPTTTVAFTPDGTMFVTGSIGDDRTFKFWDTQTFKLLKTSAKQPGYINDLKITPDGKKLVAAVKNYVKVWDLKTGSQLLNIKGPSLEINAIAISPDSRFVATANKEGTIMLFDINKGRQVTTLNGHKGWVLSLVFSPDGQFLYSGGEDKILKIWQLFTPPTR